MVPHTTVLESLNSMAESPMLIRTPRDESMPHILCIERETQSLGTRVLVFQALGCYVQSVRPGDLAVVVAEGSFRVAVFGHSLSDAETAALAIYMRAVSPGTKLVLVTGNQPRYRMMESLFAAVVPQAEGVSALAMTVRNLLASNSG